MRSVPVRMFAQVGAFIAAICLAVIGVATTVNAFEHGGCRTEQIFEAKYGKHDALPSVAKDPNACPQLGMCDDATTRDSYIPDSAQEIIYIRLYFNIMAESNGDSAAASPEDLAAEVDTLNKDYLPHRIQFTYDYRVINNSTFRYITNASQFDQMKSQYAVNPSQQMNVYVANVDISGEVYSFATFPWDPDHLSSTGGVVMSDQQFYPNDAHTLSHEIGHCFGLWHTFHGVDEVTQCGSCYESPDGPNNDTQGDLCSDTRPTPLNYNCVDPEGNDPCSGNPWAPTSLSNFMGYSPDFCVNEFTLQQSGRMNCWIRDAEITWAEPLFVYASPEFGPAPLSVNFDAQSPRQVTSWVWAFGDSQFGSVEDPVHEYSDPGVYTVETLFHSAEGTVDSTYDSLIWVQADTMIIDSINGSAGLVEVHVNLSNYIPVKTVTVPFTWVGPVDMDYFGNFTTGLRDSTITPTLLNFSASLKRAAVRLSAGSTPIPPGTGPILTLRFQINSSSPGDANPIAFLPYSSYEPGLVAANNVVYAPVFGDGGIYFPATCCVGSVGNVDGSADDAVTLSDLSALIDHLFITLAPVACPAEADVDLSGAPNPGQGDITLSDLSVMIDHLFITLDPLPACP